MKECPDKQILEDIAIEMGVDVSFIEKDWYAVRLLTQLSNIENDNFGLVFSGGTSLSKGYGLIQRFSEDLDFKIAMPEEVVSRSLLKAFRDQILAVFDKTPDMKLIDTFSRNESRYTCCMIEYPAQYEPDTALRPQLKLELTFESPRLPVVSCKVQSFVSELINAEPEVETINCIAPVETAADKLSALCWRVLSRERGSDNDDATLIRHLCDIAALYEIVIESKIDFGLLANDLIRRDINTRCNKLNIPEMSNREFIKAAIARLKEDGAYIDEYERFVNGMSYAGDDRRTSFDEALSLLEKLIQFID